MSSAFLVSGIGFGELIVVIILVIIGVVAILILSALIHFIIPIIAAVIAWFFTRSLLDAGIAFLVVALLQLILRRGR
jgi:hypothetical protein